VQQGAWFNLLSTQNRGKRSYLKNSIQASDRMQARSRDHLEEALVLPLVEINIPAQMMTCDIAHPISKTHGGLDLMICI
jgi:hypothetical protein